MKRRWLLGVAVAILVAGRGIGLARTAIGRGARAGVQEGMVTVKDAAFDAAVGAVVPEPARQVGRGANTVRQEGLGSAARQGAEAGIDASGMGPTMDTALDAADAARKTNKAR